MLKTHIRCVAEWLCILQNQLETLFIVIIIKRNCASSICVGVVNALKCRMKMNCYMKIPDSFAKMWYKSLKFLVIFIKKF